MREAVRRSAFEEAEKEFRAAECRLARAARLGDDSAARAALADLQARAARASRLYGDACSSECRCRKCAALEGVAVGFKLCAGCEFCGDYPAQRDDSARAGGDQAESTEYLPYPVRPDIPLQSRTQPADAAREQRARAARAAWYQKGAAARAKQAAMQKRADERAELGLGPLKAHAEPKVGESASERVTNEYINEWFSGGSARPRR